jgi:hypothetical protein
VGAWSKRRGPRWIGDLFGLRDPARGRRSLALHKRRRPVFITGCRLVPYLPEHEPANFGENANIQDGSSVIAVSLRLWEPTIAQWPH